MALTDAAKLVHQAAKNPRSIERVTDTVLNVWIDRVTKYQFQLQSGHWIPVYKVKYDQIVPNDYGRSHTRGFITTLDAARDRLNAARRVR